MNQYDYEDRRALLRFQAVQVTEMFEPRVTFCKILKIDFARIEVKNCWRAFEIAQSVWKKWGEPDTAARLLDCLSEIINSCNAWKVPFPAVFLLRQKQMLDGDFTPERRSAPLFEAHTNEKI